MFGVAKQSLKSLCSIRNANCKLIAQVRHFPKHLKRRPLAVMTADESEIFHGRKPRLQEQEPEPYQNPKTGASSKRYDTPATDNNVRQGGKVPPRALEESFTGFRLPEGVTFEKIKEGDKRMGPILLAAKHRKMREKKGIVLLEGRRLIMDALDAGAKIESIYFSKVEHLEGMPLTETNAKLYKAHYNYIKIWSDVSTPPGVIAICKMPKAEDMKIDTSQLHAITLICDNIRDPGNMGALLRSASAVGCRSVLLTKGCVDIWEPKVLRAGAGSHFRCHMINNLGWDLIGNYISHDSDIFLADSQTIEYQPIKAASRAVMKHIVEAEDETYFDKDESSSQLLEIDPSFTDKSTLPLYKDIPLHTVSYFDADFSSGKDVVIIVGGETEGVSPEAHKLGFERNGSKVFIPMMPGVDSLNAAMAATVILFEIKKQMLKMNKDS